MLEGNKQFVLSNDLLTSLRGGDLHIHQTTHTGGQRSQEAMGQRSQEVTGQLGNPTEMFTVLYTPRASDDRM